MGFFPFFFLHIYEMEIMSLVMVLIRNSKWLPYPAALLVVVFVQSVFIRGSGKHVDK